MKLSPTQQDFILRLYNDGAGDGMTLMLSGGNTRTTAALENKGLIRFYPYSKVAPGGAWKLTGAGKDLAKKI